MDQDDPGRQWVRPPAVAGMFYPSDPQRLRQTLRHFEQDARPGAAPRTPVAIIAPHAGYVYSGPVAASAYAWARLGRGRYKRAVIIAPAHRAEFRGLAVSSAAAFDTPLGPLAIDRSAVAELRQLPFVLVSDAAHQHEHAIEVQLPFLLSTLGEGPDAVSIVPLLAAEATPQQVAQAIELLWRPDTLVVVSSDLSHYEDYDTARELDTATSRAIERLAVDELRPEQACGCLAIQGLLLAAANRGLAAHLVDQRSSGDTAGPRDQVVGYGAYVFTD